jgi:hypothetical protein
MLHNLLELKAESEAIFILFPYQKILNVKILGLLSKLIWFIEGKR